MLIRSCPDDTVLLSHFYVFLGWGGLEKFPLSWVNPCNPHCKSFLGKLKIKFEHQCRKASKFLSLRNKLSPHLKQLFHFAHCSGSGIQERLAYSVRSWGVFHIVGGFTAVADRCQLGLHSSNGSTVPEVHDTHKAGSLSSLWLVVRLGLQMKCLYPASPGWWSGWSDFSHNGCFP